MIEKIILENDGAGEVDVQIAPIGDFTGSDKDGNPIKESITKESLDNLATKLNESGEEVLCDKDHSSRKPGANKDTSAMGWLSGFYTTLKGLFAKLKFTDRGRELVEQREMRHLSPVFRLNEDGNPIDLHSVAMTNVPAFKGFVEPILNCEPEVKMEDKENIENQEMKPEEKIEQTEEVLNSACEDKVVENACEVKNEETSKEEVKKSVEDLVKEIEARLMAELTEKLTAEITEKLKAQIDDSLVKMKNDGEVKKEVIDLQVLNSAPDVHVGDSPMEPEWKNLHGKAFFDYIAKMK